jgi:peptidyl-prolyl cis-trans isomerase B (cyclophilin B)
MTLKFNANMTISKLLAALISTATLFANATFAQTPANQAAPAKPVSQSKPAAKPVAKPASESSKNKPKGDAKKAPAAAKSTVCKLEKGTPVKVKLTTSMGAITLELDQEKAPISAENFVNYVNAGHYNGTIFHRVIGNFMIQGGGFSKDMQQKATKDPIKNESTNGLKNDIYTVAMARTGVRDSATSQFFINVKNNDFLNYSGETPQGYGYAVFGKVTEGTDVVDKMKGVATRNVGPHGDVPVEPIIIEKAECL